jgi:hypothetical protein
MQVIVHGKMHILDKWPGGARRLDQRRNQRRRAYTRAFLVYRFMEIRIPFSSGRGVMASAQVAYRSIISLKIHRNSPRILSSESEVRCRA